MYRDGRFARQAVRLHWSVAVRDDPMTCAAFLSRSSGLIALSRFFNEVLGHPGPHHPRHCIVGLYQGASAKWRNWNRCWSPRCRHRDSYGIDNRSEPSGQPLLDHSDLEFTVA